MKKNEEKLLKKNILWKKMKIFGKNIDLSEKNPKKIEILEKKK
jgi:hypothetical protein